MTRSTAEQARAWRADGGTGRRLHVTDVVRARDRGYLVAGSDRHRVLLECAECGARKWRSIRSIRAQQRCTHPIVDEATPWQDDVICRLLVMRLGPMILQEIAEALQVSRERVRQIEARALATAEASAAACGLDPDEILSALRLLEARADARSSQALSEQDGADVAIPQPSHMSGKLAAVRR